MVPVSYDIVTRKVSIESIVKSEIKVHTLKYFKLNLERTMIVKINQETGATYVFLLGHKPSID